MRRRFRKAGFGRRNPRQLEDQLTISSDRPNQNIKEARLRPFLGSRGYTSALISRAPEQLNRTSTNQVDGIVRANLMWAR